jgi:(R)-2-hydroxyglutarate---pyruvate transhydrogenase
MRLQCSFRKIVPSCTSIRFFASAPLPSRQSRFKTVDDTDILAFKNIIIEPSGIVDPFDKDALDIYNNDWMDRYKGSSKTVLRPKTTSQVSEILAYCNTNSIAVVPQGGNTGLVGGSVPVFDEVIISTQYMNNVRSFDSVSGILEADAGCVLEMLYTYLSERGYMMPLDLGAKGRYILFTQLSYRW